MGIRVALMRNGIHRIVRRYDPNVHPPLTASVHALQDIAAPSESSERSE